MGTLTSFSSKSWQKEELTCWFACVKKFHTRILVPKLHHMPYPNPGIIKKGNAIQVQAHATLVNRLRWFGSPGE